MDRTVENGERGPGGEAGCPGKGTVRGASAAKTGRPALPLVLLFALGLGACGGGGSATTGLGGGGGGSGPAGTGATRQPGLTAKGVTVSIGYKNDRPSITTFGQNGNWLDLPSYRLSPPSGWAAITRLDHHPTAATARFHTVTNIASDSDEDYLAYGFWSRNVPDTEEAAGFQPFFYGKTPYGGNVATLPTADEPLTYTGGAAGVFRALGTDEYGYFRADVELRTSFGKGSKVEGSLTGITALSPISPDVAFSDISGLFADFSGSGFAGKDAYNGRWGGRFFGPSDSGQTPTGAAGWFEKLTVGGIASLSGSFGAARQ